MSPRVRRTLVNLTVFTVTLGLGITILEILGRKVFLEGPLYYATEDVDHRPKQEWSDGINSDQIRSAIEATDIPDDAFRIIMLGDSFVEGLYLTAEEHIPAQLQGMIRASEPSQPVHVLNFGWLSSSPTLGLRQLRDIGARYRPDLVVHCLDMTDFHDEHKYQHLLDRDGLWWLLNVTPVTLILIKEASERVGPVHNFLFGYPAKRFFHSRQPLERSRKYMEPLHRNVQAVSRYVREELGAEYVLVIFPRAYQYSDREVPQNWEVGEYEPLGEYVLEPFTYFEEIRDTFDFPMYSLLGDFQTTDVFPTCFDDDPHWNPAGARLAAEFIHQRLVSDGHLDALRR